MLTEAQKAKNNKLVLEVLKRANGDEFEPITQDGNGNWFLMELIDDKPFIQRNAVPAEIEAFRLRDIEREKLAAEQREKDAEEREQAEGEVRARILQILPHGDGQVRIKEVGDDGKTYAFKTAEEAAEYAVWQMDDHEFEPAPEPVVESSEAEQEAGPVTDEAEVENAKA